jgi:hypothetical protein
MISVSIATGAWSAIGLSSSLCLVTQQFCSEQKFVYHGELVIYITVCFSAVCCPFLWKSWLNVTSFLFDHLMYSAICLRRWLLIAEFACQYNSQHLFFLKTNWEYLGSVHVLLLRAGNFGKSHVHGMVARSIFLGLSFKICDYRILFVQILHRFSLW